MSNEPRVNGIGGVFFTSAAPEELKAWYAQQLGFDVDQYGSTFAWRKADEPEQLGFTQWSVMPENTPHFVPSKSGFMINYRVQYLEALLLKLRKAGVEVVGDVQVESYGKFAHILDPEGNKIELWEPNDSAYASIIGAQM